MKKKYYLPKNDIDVYVLPVQKVNRINTEEIIKNELEKRHPGYSANHTFDYKIITFEMQKHMLVTVINKIRLDEHRILAGNKRMIGIDSLAVVNGALEPVLEVEHESLSNKEFQQSLLRLNLHTAEVFKKKKNKVMIGGFLLVLSTIFLVTVGVIGNQKKPRELVLEESVVNDEVKPFAPDLLTILHDISSVIVECKGFAVSAFVSYASSLVIDIQLQGVDPSLFLSAIKKIQYLRNTQLSGITYEQNIAQFSVSFSLSNSYSPPSSEPVVLDDFVIIMPIFRKLIINDGGTVISEQLENDISSKKISASYSISMPKASNHFKCLDSFLKINKIHLSALSLEINSDKNSLDVLIKMNKNSVCDDNQELFVDQTTILDYSIIPLSFGFIPKTPVRIESKIMDSPIDPGWEKIGQILNDDGITVAYFRDRDGKIHACENH